MRSGGHFCVVRALCLGVLLAAFGHEAQAQQQPAPSEAPRTVYVVNHGWHAGLVLRRGDAPAMRWPEQEDFPDATYLEVGWGDSAYYRNPDPDLGTLLKAGLWPTPSVLHVVGFSRPVIEYFPVSEVIRIDLPAAGLDSLAAFIHAAYARDEEGRPMPLGPGLYGESQFYAGKERYHVFRNCNAWTARALHAAGSPIDPAGIMTVGDLLRRVRRFGEVIQKPEE